MKGTPLPADWSLRLEHYSGKFSVTSISKFFDTSPAVVKRWIREDENFGSLFDEAPPVSLPEHFDLDDVIDDLKFLSEGPGVHRTMTFETASLNRFICGVRREIEFQRGLVKNYASEINRLRHRDHIRNSRNTSRHKNGESVKDQRIPGRFDGPGE